MKDKLEYEYLIHYNGDTEYIIVPGLVDFVEDFIIGEYDATLIGIKYGNRFVDSNGMRELV